MSATSWSTATDAVTLQQAEYIVPFVLVMLSMTLLYWQVYFVGTSTFCSRISCWQRKPTSDNTLIKWQMVSTTLGFVSVSLSCLIWTKNVSESFCGGVIRSSHFFLLLSEFVLYGFYESRLSVVRMDRKRTALEKLLLVFVFLFPILAILEAVFASRETQDYFGVTYCSGRTPVPLIAVEMFLSLCLNPGYAYCFAMALKNVKEWKQKNSSNSSTASTTGPSASQYKSLIRRNTRASILCAIATIGATIGLVVIDHASLQAPIFAYNAIRSLSVAVWCTSMLYCTKPVWRSKCKRAKKHSSSAVIEAGSVVVKSPAPPTPQENNKNSGLEAEQAIDIDPPSPRQV